MTERDTHQVSELAGRLVRLYTGAVGDVLDRWGYREQLLPARICGLTFEMKVAGPAFPGFFTPAEDVNVDDDPRRAEMLDSIPRGSVAIWATSGVGPEAGHWGELMTRAAMARGCRGVVLDAGIRDTEEILALGFPIFCSYRHPADATGRWSIADWGCEIRIGQTLVRSNDFVMADIDGIVIIPREIVTDVVADAEAIRGRELKMRRDLDAGDRSQDVIHRYGKV